jgi:hypothetical protein
MPRLGLPEMMKTPFFRTVALWRQRQPEEPEGTKALPAPAATPVSGVQTRCRSPRRGESRRPAAAQRATGKRLATASRPPVRRPMPRARVAPRQRPPWGPLNTHDCWPFKGVSISSRRPTDAGKTGGRSQRGCTVYTGLADKRRLDGCKAAGDVTGLGPENVEGKLRRNAPGIDSATARPPTVKSGRPPFRLPLPVRLPRQSTRP